MGLFSWFGSWFSDGLDHSETEINPASGLPMVGGTGGVDIEGNPYGMDNHDDAFDSTISDSFNDAFDSSFDDW